MALVESLGDPTLDGGAVLRRRSTPRSRPASGRRAAVVAEGHRPGRRRPGQRQLHHRVAVGARLGVRGLSPVSAWVVRDGATTCDTAWPWPAAPTRCPTPRSSPTSTSRRYRSGVLRPDDSALREIEDALQIAERSGDDFALALARTTLGLALVHRHPLRSVTADRSCWPRSATVLCSGGYLLCDLPVVNVYFGAGAGSARRSR